MIQKSMSLNCEPASEPLHISVRHLFSMSVRVQITPLVTLGFGIQEEEEGEARTSVKNEQRVRLPGGEEVHPFSRINCEIMFNLSRWCVLSCGWNVLR